MSDISVTANGNLENTGGSIASARDLNITANTIIGNGNIIAGRDGNISLQGNYTNATGNVFKANNNLTFSTTGNFINQADLEAVGTLSVSAAKIDNQANALFDANLTRLTAAGDITNAGYIGGNTVETHSNNITNTATIMGDVVSLYANNLNNLGSNALIAATGTINLIIASSLVNQSNALESQTDPLNRHVATIYSLGDINIGSSLTQNANGYLAGNTASISNQSATIEAMGSLRLSADSIVNTRTVYGVEYGPSWTGAYVSGNPNYTPTFANQQFTASTTASSQILSGANMWINIGAGLTNNYSDIIAGGTINVPPSQLPFVSNNGPAFLQSESDVGSITVLVNQVVGWSCNIIGKNCSPNYGLVPVVQPYAPATSYKAIPGSVNVNYLPNTQHAGTSHAIATQTVAPSGAATGNLTVPTNGLYTIHNQPGQPYLVVTDPRFTSYANFISSDYMLSRLSLDPQQMQMRLGDGFYEQQLVTQQITADTGRMYVDGNTNAQSQFIALMNSGIDASKDFNLTIGVALTAAQINSLKHDIVWMVDRNVTLPNGTTVSVLAPQVYLSSVQEADLKPSGALISANVININGSSVNNSGTIRANTALSINANDITNQGGTINSGGSNTLVASNDILNLSGAISGTDISLTAGRDIRNETTSQDVTRTINGNVQTGTGLGFANVSQASVSGVVKDTELGLVAGISATNSVNMNAGRDVSIVGAAVYAEVTPINAGRDLTVGVLTATNSSTASQNAAYRTEVTQHTSSIQTGGNLTLASGNDMHLTSAALNIGKDATLVSGGDLTLDASKNSISSGYNTGSAIGRFNDETVLGTTLNAGGNVSLVATQLNTDAATQASGTGSPVGRTDGKGNIALQSADITSKTGQLTLAADANVNIGVTAENHDAYTALHSAGSGLFTHTTLDVRNESWRTDNVGSKLSADSISITSGKNIDVTGSAASAAHNINVAAMGDVNISAATNTYGSNSYSHETTTGLQFNIRDAFGITDSGPDITTQAHTDGTKQSFSRSNITSNSGNLSIVSGGNLIASGTDLAANVGDLALTAGGTVALLAGQDTLNQSSSTVIVTNPNFFTKQHHTITDTSSSLDYQGSTAQANSIKISSGADTVFQAAQVTAGAGGINIDASGDLKLLAAVNTNSSSHTETLSTDGMSVQATDTTRRIKNTADNQNQTNQVTTLTSAGDISTHSGGDTLIEASKLNAQGSIDLTATGYAATTNADGSTNQGRAGTITFAAVKDSTYNSVANSNNSVGWQNSNGSGDYVETLKLANISAGKGLNVNATGGVAIDIPTVQATPAPAAQIDAKGNIIPPVALTAEQQAAQRQADLNKAIQNLASQPGQAWIGQLANNPKVQVQWNQVQTAVQHWNYNHDGLTPEGMAIVAIVVTYCTAGAGAGAVGTAAGTTAETAATEYVVTTAVVQAAITTLATQASISLINNKGDIGKTLNDMGSSQNVKSLVTAMLTAGVMAGLSGTDFMKGIQSGANAPLSASSLLSKLELDLTNATVNTAINSAVYGTSFTDALGNNLKNAGIDTLAAVTANVIGQSYKADGGLLNGQPVLHDLAHAVLGCASASAKGQDCGSMVRWEALSAKQLLDFLEVLQTEASSRRNSRVRLFS